MNRRIKKKISERLCSSTPDDVLALLDTIPLKQAVTPLISALYSPDPGIKWNAVVALGHVIAGIAQEDMEHARTIMRRFIWSLNDESGGIGWGAAETMAESMALHEGLYEEYARILLSFIREDGNYLEYPPLRRGALWGLARLGHARPLLLKKIEARAYLLGYLHDEDAESRALAAWALGVLGTGADTDALEKLAVQTDDVDIYMQGRLRHLTVGEIAQESIRRLSEMPDG